MGAGKCTDRGSFQRLSHLQLGPIPSVHFPSRPVLFLTVSQLPFEMGGPGVNSPLVVPIFARHYQEQHLQEQNFPEKSVQCARATITLSATKPATHQGKTPSFFTPPQQTSHKHLNEKQKKEKLNANPLTD